MIGMIPNQRNARTERIRPFPSVPLLPCIQLTFAVEIRAPIAES
jgi:hypothetical protein